MDYTSQRDRNKIVRAPMFVHVRNGSANACLHVRFCGRYRG